MEISKELLSEILNVEISEVTGTLTHKNNKSLLSYITKNCSINEGKELINIYELAFRTRDYFKIRSKHLSLNQNIDDIFKEANSIYESLRQ